MANQAKSFIATNRGLIKFISLGILLLILWVILTAIFPTVLAKMHYLIIEPQTDISAGILTQLGYDLTQTYLANETEARIVFPENGFIAIGSGCSGLELFLLFFFFIALMRGRIKDKLWFVPLGIVIILVLNIIRITTLSVIFFHYPKYLEFNHKYTFVIIVYGAIFGLWILWLHKFATRTSES